MLRNPALTRRVVLAASTLAVLALAAPLATADDPPARGLHATYFDDVAFGQAVLERVDPAIDFDWAAGSPGPGVAPETYSVRWTGSVTVPAGGRWRFRTTSDDGVRLWIGGRLVVDDWKLHSKEERRSPTLQLPAGAHDLKLEFYNGPNVGSVKLEWEGPGVARQVVPASALSHGAPPASAPTAPPVDPDTLDLPATTTVPTSAPAAADPLSETLPPPAPPQAGETFNAQPTGGEVLVRREGDDRLFPLTRAASLPVGTRLDTRGGTVKLETAPAKRVKRKRQWAKFRGATFVVAQPAGGEKVVRIDMTHGDFEACPKGSVGSLRKASAARRGGSKTVRKLFGRGKGRFETRGRHAAATVRGTVWEVEDRCDATIVHVTTGVVDVEDFRTGRTTAVRAGQEYSTAR